MPLKEVNKNTWQYVPLSAEEKEGIIRTIKEASFLEDIPNIEEDIRNLDIQGKIRYLKKVVECNHRIKGNKQIDDISKWATENIEKLEIRLRRMEGETTTNNKSPKKESLKFMALKDFYMGKPMPDKATEKYKQHYRYYAQAINRTALETTQTKNKNKIKLLESVVASLPKNKCRRAKDELDLLIEKVHH